MVQSCITSNNDLCIGAGGIIHIVSLTRPMDRPLSAFEKIPQASPPHAAITRDELDRPGGEVISQGRWANAVLRVIRRDGEPWIVKDFRPRTFIVRNTIGRLLVRREMRALSRLAGLSGVPADAVR